MRPALRTESQNAAASLQVFVGIRLFGRGFKPRILDPRNFRVVFQKLGKLQGVGAVTLHAKRKRLQIHVYQERVLRRQNRARIAHYVRARLDQKREFAKLLGVNHAVVAFIRRAKIGEFRVVVIEVSLVNDNSAHCRGMPVCIL